MLNHFHHITVKKKGINHRKRYFLAQTAWLRYYPPPCLLVARGQWRQCAILFLVDGCRFIAIDYCAASGGASLGSAARATVHYFRLGCVMCGWLLSCWRLHYVSWQISTTLIKHYGMLGRFETKGSMGKEQEMKFSCPIPALDLF